MQHKNKGKLKKLKNSRLASLVLIVPYRESLGRNAMNSLSQALSVQRQVCLAAMQYIRGRYLPQHIDSNIQSSSMRTSHGLIYQKYIGVSAMYDNHHTRNFSSWSLDGSNCFITSLWRLSYSRSIVHSSIRYHWLYISLNSDSIFSVSLLIVHLKIKSTSSVFSLKSSSEISICDI